MPNKIDDFKEYARKRIVDKLREENSEPKIESYDNEDASYSGSEEDYRDYLNTLDIDEENTEPLPVENTQRIGENIQNVINKVKKTAGRMAETLSAKSDEGESVNTDEDNALNSLDSNKNEDVNQQVLSEDAAVPPSQEYGEVLAQLNTALTNLSEINTRLQTIELKVNDAQRQSASDNNVVRDLLDKTMNMTLDIKNTINSVSKLNDSIFDLKNSQQNVKMSVSDVESAFKRLKSKCITGFTIISIIGLITIALEVINLLS